MRESQTQLGRTDDISNIGPGFVRSENKTLLHSGQPLPRVEPCPCRLTAPTATVTVAGPDDVEVLDCLEDTVDEGEDEVPVVVSVDGRIVLATKTP